MTHRIISCDYPARALDHVRAVGCLCRSENTAYRGPIAVIGQGRVWAVATLREVKPVVTKLPKKDKELDEPCGFYWCFEELRDVEVIPCAIIAAPAMFQNSDGWEPLFLQAGPQAILNRLLSSQDAPEQPQTASDVSASTQEAAAPELASSAPSGGQMELF